MRANFRCDHDQLGWQEDPRALHRGATRPGGSRLDPFRRRLAQGDPSKILDGAAFQATSSFREESQRNVFVQQDQTLIVPFILEHVRVSLRSLS